MPSQKGSSRIRFPCFHLREPYLEMLKLLQKFLALGSVITLRIEIYHAG